MDIIKPQKPWYIKYRMYIAGATALLSIITYTIFLALSPVRQRVKGELIKIAEVEETAFMEFVETEGIIHPIMVIQLNAGESGFVKSIVREEGSMLQRGDTILVLENPELLRTIEQESEQWNTACRNLREQEIQMEQRSIDLKLQALEQQTWRGNLHRRVRNLPWE